MYNSDMNDKKYDTWDICLRLSGGEGCRKCRVIDHVRLVWDEKIDEYFDLVDSEGTLNILSTKVLEYVRWLMLVGKIEYIGERDMHNVNICVIIEKYMVKEKIGIWKELKM
jgi:hypothetical protein